MTQIKTMVIFLLFFFLLAGCAHVVPKPRPSPPEDLDAGIDSLFEQVIRSIRNNETCEFMLISSTLREGRGSYTKLEDHILKSLNRRLRRELQTVPPRREDWIYLKNGEPPISLPESKPFAILKLQVHEPLEGGNKITVSVSAYRFSRGKELSVPSVGGEVTLNARPDSPAEILYSTPAIPPLPVGTLENPYLKLDEMANSLVSEALGDYMPGAMAVVDTKADPDEICRKMASSIQSAVKESLIRKGVKITTRPKSADIYFVDVRRALCEETLIKVTLKVRCLGGYYLPLIGIAYWIPPQPPLDTTELRGEGHYNAKGQLIFKREAIRRAAKKANKELKTKLPGNLPEASKNRLDDIIEKSSETPCITWNPQTEQATVIKTLPKSPWFLRTTTTYRGAKINSACGISVDNPRKFLEDITLDCVKDSLSKYGYVVNNRAWRDTYIEISSSVQIYCRPFPFADKYNKGYAKITCTLTLKARLLKAKDGLACKEITTVRKISEVRYHCARIEEGMKRAVIKAAKGTASVPGAVEELVNKIWQCL